MTLCATCLELEPYFIGNAGEPRLSGDETCDQCGQSSLDEKRDLMGK